MDLKTNVSVGEILDKLSVLQIKLEKISDENKKKEIKKELKILTDLCKKNLKNYEEWVTKLKETNVKIWDLVDKQWELEKANKYDESCIELSRRVIKVNDERFQIKKQINEHYGSNIKEVKSYD